jgi:hypothetical protein
MHELILLTAMSVTGGMFGHKAKCPPAPVAVAAPVACVPAPKKAGCFGGMKMGKAMKKMGHSGKKQGAPLLVAAAPAPTPVAAPLYATSQAAPIASGVAPAAPAPAAPAPPSIPPAPVSPGVTGAPAAVPPAPVPVAPEASTPAAPAAAAPAAPAVAAPAVPPTPAVPGVEPK